MKDFGETTPADLIGQVWARRDEAATIIQAYAHPPLNGALEGVRLRKSKGLERNSHQSRV